MLAGFNFEEVPDAISIVRDKSKNLNSEQTEELDLSKVLM